VAKYCEQCGERLEDDAVFCTGCGQRVAINMPIQAPTYTYYNQPVGADYASQDESLGWFNYRGRLNRQRYIFRSLILSIFLIVMSIMLVGGIAFLISAAEQNRGSGGAGMGLIIILLVVAGIIELMLIVESYFLLIKRGHDINLSGWVSVLIQFASGGVFSIVLYFIKGNMGPNQYGEDPLNYPGSI